MIININTTPNALECILRHVLDEAIRSYTQHHKTQHGGSRDAYAHAFNVAYGVLHQLSRCVVKDYLSPDMRLQWEKVDVYYKHINNVKDVDTSEWKWCNNINGNQEGK